MNKTALCLISLLMSANVFAQSSANKDVQNGALGASKQANVKVKPFVVTPSKIPVGKGDKVEPIDNKDFKKKTKELDKVPDFLKKQQEKLAKNPPVITGKEKVFPPNITNFTAEDIKNDPTLNSNKAFYIKEEFKPALSVVEEYNQRRAIFLKKRERARIAGIQKAQQGDEVSREAHRLQAMKDEYRKKMGFPITRFENTGGSTNREAGITREMMSVLNPTGNKMPAVPPTGNIQNLPQR